jgi:alpha-L-rhamnosidase
MNHRNGHIDAGITGGALLTRLLIEENQADLMYPMILKEDYPSWGYFLKSGQTTWPESWDNSNSQLHSSYIFVGAWFIEGLLGIRPGPQGGYQHFELRPLLNLKPRLDFVKGHYDSMWGRIAVEWKVVNHVTTLNVDIPTNTDATLFVDDGLDHENGNAVHRSVRLGPGHHRLVAQIK